MTKKIDLLVINQMLDIYKTNRSVIKIVTDGGLEIYNLLDKAGNVIGVSTELNSLLWAIEMRIGIVLIPEYDGEKIGTKLVKEGEYYALN